MGFCAASTIGVGDVMCSLVLTFLFGTLFLSSWLALCSAFALLFVEPLLALGLHLGFA